MVYYPPIKTHLACCFACGLLAAAAAPARIEGVSGAGEWQTFTATLVANDGWVDVVDR